MWIESVDLWLPKALVVAYVALLGAVLGSFLNVCILRWGAEPKQSVMRPPSRCPSCGHAIRWHENVPVISWLMLRGRCSGCGTRISPMYPVIEATTALLWGGSVALLGPGLPALQLAVASTLLLGIAVSDARAFIIPHEFSLGGTAMALAFAAWPGPPGVLDAIAGALFGAGVVLLAGELTELALGQEAMGGGDCALMGMIGAFFGWEAVWPVLGLGAFIGIVVHVAVASLRRPVAVGEPAADPAGGPAADPAADPALVTSDLAPAVGDDPSLGPVGEPALVIGAEPVPATADPAPPPTAGSRTGIQWDKLFQLLAAGIVPLALLVLAAWVGVLAPVLRALFYALLGAGAAYYGSFVMPKRMLQGPVAQVWGLVGAGLGVAVSTRHWIGALVGLGLGGGALLWSSRREVSASPATTEELSAQGYLPFGVGLSIAAVLLAFAGGFEWVRQAFAEIAPGLGLS